MRRYFAEVRRAGFDIGVSAGKLARAMVEVLLQLPPETTPSKEEVVLHLGLLGQMSKTRDINAAWNSAKRQVVREHANRFSRDGKVLRWATALKNRRRNPGAGTHVDPGIVRRRPATSMKASIAW